MSRVVKAQHPISPSEESVSGVRPYLLPGQSGSVECEKSGEVRVTRWVRECGRSVGGRGVTPGYLTDLFKPSCDVGIWAHL